MHAIILAGGLGTRLRTILPDLPKPMAPVRGKAFLAHLLDYLATQGITRVTLSVCYRWQLIQDYFKSSYAGIAIDYVVEHKALGTGGAIANVFAHLKADDPVFVINGDTFVYLNYRQMYDSRASSDLLTMGVCYVSDCSRYGRVTVSDSLVMAFEKKGESVSGFINVGVYLIHPDIFKLVELPRTFSFENDFLSAYTSMLKPATFFVEGYFIDIGVPEDYLRIQSDILSLNR